MRTGSESSVGSRGQVPRGGSARRYGHWPLKTTSAGTNINPSPFADHQDGSASSTLATHHSRARGSSPRSTSVRLLSLRTS